MALFLAQQGMTHVRDITVQDANGDPIIPQANDQVRAVCVDGCNNEVLSVASNAPTANGSTFTKNSPSSGVNRLRLDGADLNFAPGNYTIRFEYFDNADGQTWKTVSRQVFALEAT